MDYFYQCVQERRERTASALCIGLDPQDHILIKCDMENHLLDYNVAIVEQVADYCCAFKLQFAHYAALRCEEVVRQTIDYLKQNHPHIPVILDAKRGDIGLTAVKYAEEAYIRYRADAVTVNPYLGTDCIDPFFVYPDKIPIILLKTSNPSSVQVQDLILSSGDRLYLYLAHFFAQAYPQRALWFVVGGTFSTALKEVKKVCPNACFLVPGVGTQGGDVEKIIRYSKGENILLNVSSAITSPRSDFSDFKSYLVEVRNNAARYHEVIANEIVNHAS